MRLEISLRRHLFSRLSGLILVFVLINCSETINAECRNDMDCSGMAQCLDGLCKHFVCPEVPCQADEECIAEICYPKNCPAEQCLGTGQVCMSDECVQVCPNGLICNAGEVCFEDSCCAGTQAQEASCDDLIDNDCDGLTDKADPDCLVECQLPSIFCGEQCIDVSGDQKNCGSCGSACASQQNCIKGECLPVCVLPQIACSGSCVDPRTDNGNCGSCGNACTSEQMCKESNCTEDCGQQDFVFTGTQESFTIPARVRYLHVKAWGSGANGEGQCTPNDDGGLGGYSEAIFPVTEGEQYVVIVGEKGRSGSSGGTARFGFGTWGGGGLSGVFWGPGIITENDRSKALIIAGGGGGASAPGCHPGGTGNHPNAGTQGNMMGSGGGDGVNGGGGGYSGGTGGSSGVQGNGGSGIIHSTAVSGRSQYLYAEPKSGSPPKTDDPEYNGSAGKTESPGLVVLHLLCGLPAK